MDKDFVEKMKATLMHEREEIMKTLDTQKSDMKNLIKAGESGDVVDVASDVIDRQLLGSLYSQGAERLEQIDAALTRIRLGHYGICAKCGQDIPEARLKALPYAVLCVKCASSTRS